MMNAKYVNYLFAFFAFLLISGTGFFLFKKFSFDYKVNKIKQEIADAGYCSQKSDCEIVPSQCPFDCYAPVNKKEARRIKEIIDNFKSNCVYGCVEIQGVDCVNQKCVIQR